MVVFRVADLASENGGCPVKVESQMNNECINLKYKNCMGYIYTENIIICLKLKANYQFYTSHQQRETNQLHFQPVPGLRGSRFASYDK